jgi:hypothetical protein
MQAKIEKRKKFFSGGEPGVLTCRLRSREDKKEAGALLQKDPGRGKTISAVFEGCALGAFAAAGVRIPAAAHFNGVQSAEILVLCVISAGIHAALDAVVDFVHG